MNEGAVLWRAGAIIDAGGRFGQAQDSADRGARFASGVGRGSRDPRGERENNGFGSGRAEEESD
jgi:hypothetical protein